MFALTMRRTVGSLIFWVGVAVFAVVLAVLIGSIVNTMRNVQPVHADVPPVSAVAWGDRVFVGPDSLAHWLKVRGIGYSVWADRHPPANHLLQREKAQRTRSKK